MERPNKNRGVRVALLASTLLALASAAAVVSSCASSNSATDLYPVGPPMVRQVRMTEDFQNTDGSFFTRTVFGFGTFPGLTSDAEHQVTSALAVNNRFRIIMDELVEGNFLEQVACRGAIDAAGDTYGSVPLGATPDDIVKCCQATELLPTTCVGPYATCVGPDPTHPVGILDANEDGAADDTRFLPGAVEIHCTDPAGKKINVPLDLDNSYWNPSGDQQEPAEGGLDALGPAIVLVAETALPTDTTCNLFFSPTVIDKTRMSVCIPAFGLPPGITDDAGNVGSGCQPTGDEDTDFGQFKFTVEALRVTDSVPTSGDTGVPLTGSIQLSFDAPLDQTTLAGITVTSAAGPAAFTVTTTQNNTRVTLTITGSLAPNTVYTINVPTTVKDAYGEPLSSAAAIMFTTGS
jgi:hypothetical protein